MTSVQILYAISQGCGGLVVFPFHGGLELLFEAAALQGDGFLCLIVAAEVCLIGIRRGHFTDFRLKHTVTVGAPQTTATAVVLEGIAAGGALRQQVGSVAGCGGVFCWFLHLADKLAHKLIYAFPEGFREELFGKCEGYAENARPSS